jgi:integrase
MVGGLGLQAEAIIGACGSATGSTLLDVITSNGGSAGNSAGAAGRATPGGTSSPAGGAGSTGTDAGGRGFAAAVEWFGLEDVTPHDLRRTAAVWMAEDGVSFEEIAQFLGHSSPKVTFEVYARFSPTHLRKASKSLEF